MKHLTFQFVASKLLVIAGCGLASYFFLKAAIFCMNNLHDELNRWIYIFGFGVLATCFALAIICEIINIYCEIKYRLK
jgi:hypothetical protein